MRRALALALLMVAVPMVGCIGGDDAPPTDPSAGGAGAPLTEKVYDILPVEVVWVATSVDGKQMHNAVYRPDTDEPVPVFINFSPYWGDTAEQRGDNFAQYLIEEYVPRGYAVVLSAIRGTGHSEGCFQIAGDKELASMVDVIDHFAGAQWSNGHIIAGGKSYDSTPQNGLVAKTPHPALKGLFHVSGITDMYRYNYRMGVPYGHGTIFNTYYYLQGTDEYGASLIGAGEPQDEGPDSLARAIDDAACPELPFIQAHGIGSGVTGQKTDYWIERDWNRYVADTDWNGSIFFVHGLQDWNVKPDHILPWLQRLPDQVRVKGWLHQDDENLGHVYPMRADWNRTMLAWLDHVGKGKQVDHDWGIEAEGSDGLWRAGETWPPETSPPTTLHPKLTEGAADELAGQGQVEAVLATATRGPVRYAGAPTITLTATSDHSDPVLTAVLYEENEDGERTWINEAVLRGQYRGGLEQPEPVPVGESVEYTLEFYPQDDVLEPGHTWVLVLGGEPRHAQPAPGQVDGVTYQEIHGVDVPLAPTDTLVSPQPEPIPCFAC